MKVKRLDHIALYMGDRDSAGFLTTHLGFHVVDHTERYTLVGPVAGSASSPCSTPRRVRRLPRGRSNA